MNRFYDYIVDIQKIMHEQIGMQLSNVQREPESQEYGAALSLLHEYFVRLRIAKITPTKTGQFVTLYKRIGNGPIMPFDQSDEIDFIIIFVIKNEQKGFFIFPKSVLIAQGVFSQHGIGGKRAIRVYAPFDVVESKQARATQAWQVRYFIMIQHDGLCDKVAVQKIVKK